MTWFYFYLNDFKLRCQTRAHDLPHQWNMEIAVINFWRLKNGSDNASCSPYCTEMLIF